MPNRVLLVDRQHTAWDPLEEVLRAGGYRVLRFADMATAMSAMANAPPRLVLMEWCGSGRAAAMVRHLRTQARGRYVPVIALSARRSVDATIEALQAGADDLISSVCDAGEIAARIEALQRRCEASDPSAPHADARAVSFAGLHLDPVAMRAICVSSGQQLALGRIAFKLLHFMASRPGRIFSRGQLLDRVWGNGALVGDRTVDVHVSKIREALGDAGSHVRIETVRGEGYRLSDT